MNLRFYIQVIFFYLSGLSSFAQLLYFQDNFKGGVAVDGHSYTAMSYFGADTIKFQNSVPSGCTLRKAVLVSHKVEEHFNPNNNTIPVFSYNQHSISFDSSEIATGVFYCDNTYSTKNWLEVKDVTALTNNSSNVLVLPFVNGTNYKFYDVVFFLVILYDNPLMPSTNAAIFLNTSSYSVNMNYNLSGLNPMNNSKNVGFSVLPTNTSVIDSIKVSILSSLGTYSLGSLYLPYSSSADHLAQGSFFYQNDTLYGLADDTPNTTVDSTDALANIQSYIASNATTFTTNINLGATSPGCLDIVEAFILAYSSPCPVYQNVPLQTHVVCGRGKTVQLSASSSSQNSIYSWYPAGNLNNSTISNPVATPTASASYVVTVTDSLGCHHTEQHRIIVDDRPTIDSVRANPYVCGGILGSAVVFVGNTNTDTLWYTVGNTAQLSSGFSLLNGSYTVTVKDKYGCGDTTSVVIPFINPAHADFNLIPDTACNETAYQFNNSSTGVNTYQWYVNDSLFSSSKNPSNSFSKIGTDSITLIAFNNFAYCSDTMTRILTVVKCKLSIETPNIFTPNGDGLNETWHVNVKETGSSSLIFNLTIFNRWGIKVFETSDFNSGWDGRTTSGEICTEGVYYFVVRYNNLTGTGAHEEQTIKGYLQLVR